MMLRKLCIALTLLLVAGTAMATPPLPEIGTTSPGDVEAARLASSQHFLGSNPAEWEDVEGMARQAHEMGYTGGRANDDNDTAHYARGRTCIIHVFISHNGGTWTTAERDAANAKAIVAKEHFMDVAPAAANLSFDNDGSTNYFYYNADLDYTIPYSGTTTTVVNDALIDIGFSDSDGDGTRVDDLTFFLQSALDGGYDNVIASFQSDVNGRAWAAYGDAQIRLYNDSDGNVWAHEMGHSFGACDEYTEGGQCNGGIDCGLCQSWYLDYDVDNGNCQLATCPIDVSCIMINNTFAAICDYTLQHWGWWDGNIDGQLDKVERRVSGSTFADIWEIWHNGWFWWNNVDNGMVAAQRWNSWAVFGLRSPDTADYDPILYADNNHNIELASSLTGYEVDFIVGDYNHNPLGNEHIEVVRYSGDTASYNLTFESGTGMLYPDGISRAGTWQDYNTVRVWDVPLIAGETITFSLDVQTAALDLGMALFKSDGSGYFAPRTSAVMTANAGAAGADESFTYTVPADDVYGLVFWSDTQVDGDFAIRIGPSPWTLSEESPFNSGYDLRLFNYDPNAGYWSVIGTRPQPGTNVVGTLYADENYLTELESSSQYGAGYTEFVAVDYLHAPFNRDHWRVARTSGTGTHRTEWEHDSDILRGYTSETWPDNHVVKIWDFYGLAGQNYFFRQYDSDPDLDTALYLMSSNDGDYYKRRNAYYSLSNAQGPAEDGEHFNATMPGNDWYGLVVTTHDDNGGGYSLMAGPDVILAEDMHQTWSNEVIFASNTINSAWWTVFGVRPDTGASADIWLYGDDNYSIGTLAASDQSVGDGVNFVVGDYNHIGSGSTVYPRFMDGSIYGNTDIEYEGGGETLLFTYDDANLYDLNWPAGDVVEIWDAYLYAGEAVRIQVKDLTGNLDLGVALFASSGAAYYASEEGAAVSSNMYGVGGTETIIYYPPANDWYGVVVYNENDYGGSYRITVQDESSVPAADLPLPESFALEAASANPFAGAVSLRYSLAADGPVTLDVFDVRGRRVRSLLSGHASAGRHLLAWDGKDDAGQDLPGGVYLARLGAGNTVLSTKLVRMH